MLISPGSVVFNWVRGIHAGAVLTSGVVLIAIFFFGIPAALSGFKTSSEVSEYRSRMSDRASNEKPTSNPLHKLPFKPVALIFGVLFVLWSIGGHFIYPTGFVSRHRAAIPDIPKGTVQRLRLNDGAEIHMETHGPTSAMTVILTHGWSLNRRQWVWLQKEWNDQFRVIVWDLPGFGNSKSPSNRDFSLENMARQLKTVIDACAPGPVVLVGHSIGGMIILTFCRLFPDEIGHRVSRLVLAHTTYTNPIRTMASRHLFERLQKSLIEPLLHLQIYASPLVWCLNWLSFWNGSLHRAVAKTGFSANAPRTELDFVASFYPLGSPAILARGALAMLAFDATPTLPGITIPVLVVAGSDDPITQLDASQQMQRCVPQAKLEVYDPGKHFGFMEYHSEFAKTTADFCMAKS
jgi:pimeloyl-ACP methyl ester carboxylesterase